MNDLIPCESCNALIPTNVYFSHVYTCVAINRSFFETTPYSTPSPSENEEENVITNEMIDKAIPSLNVIEKIECFVCLEQIKGHIKELPCGHKMCVRCSHVWFKKSPCCAFCRKKIL